MIQSNNYKNNNHDRIRRIEHENEILWYPSTMP